jgi:hypothetical protein
MWILFIVAAAVVVCFAAVLLVGAPYLPTLHRQTETALDMLALRPGERLLELGSGDGTVMLAAARRGLDVVGYELNPLLALVSRWRLRKYRQQTQVIWGNYWTKPWPPSAAIFYFGLNKFMVKLDTKITQEMHHPIKLASFAFKVPGKKPLQQRDGIFLYSYNSKSPKT